MGIFDFFKSKKEEPKKEKVNFSELDNWLNSKRKQNKEKERIAIEATCALIDELIGELKEKQEILKKIDIQDRKAEERLKLVVLQNLLNYSYYLEKLIDRLGNLEKENFEKLMQDIDNIFLEFRQKSALSFEKATILIGDELGGVRDSIGKFSKKLSELLAEKKELISFLKVISSAENKLGEINREDRSKKDISVAVQNIEDEIAGLESENTLAKSNIEKIKKNADYLRQEEEKKQAKAKKNELEKEIFKLRELIDFKSLAKNFHSDPKKMNILQSYEKDFNKVLEEEGESKILGLLEDGKKKTAQGMIKEINKERREIQEIMSRKDGLESLGYEIIKFSSDIKNLNSEKLREEKRMQKIEENIIAIKKSLQNELSAIGVEVN